MTTMRRTLEQWSTYLARDISLTLPGGFKMRALADDNAVRITVRGVDAESALAAQIAAERVIRSSLSRAQLVAHEVRSEHTGENLVLVCTLREA